MLRVKDVVIFSARVMHENPKTYLPGSGIEPSSSSAKSGQRKTDN